MAEPYPWTQRIFDRATLWSLSRLLAAVLRLAAVIRRRSGPGPQAC